MDSVSIEKYLFVSDHFQTLVYSTVHSVHSVY